MSKKAKLQYIVENMVCMCIINDNMSNYLTMLVTFLSRHHHLVLDTMYQQLL